MSEVTCPPDLPTVLSLAHILGHEYGHLIGWHIEKQKNKALAGALILGALTAAANGYTASYGGYYHPNAVSQRVDVGAAFGSKAYSQSYELESDTQGTRIAAIAGHDPVKGAMFFARPKATNFSELGPLLPHGIFKSLDRLLLSKRSKRRP